MLHFMKHSFWNSIKNGCFIFTLITVISYTFGMIISTSERSFISSLTSIYLFLILSICLAFANRILTNKKMNVALRLIIHFFITGLLFFAVIVLGGGYSESGFATLIAMAVFAVIYLIFALIFGIISAKKEKKANAKKEYHSVFK